MRFIFKESRIWEGSGGVDPSGQIKSVRAKSEIKARRNLPKLEVGREWILIEIMSGGVSNE